MYCADTTACVYVEAVAKGLCILSVSVSCVFCWDVHVYMCVLLGCTCIHVCSVGMYMMYMYTCVFCWDVHVYMCVLLGCTCIHVCSVGMYMYMYMCFVLGCTWVCCVALPCLFDLLASFFLPSHLSLKTCTCICICICICMYGVYSCM